MSLRRLSLFVVASTVVLELAATSDETAEHAAVPLSAVMKMLELPVHPCGVIQKTHSASPGSK